MSRTICFRYFPAECNNTTILPFLGMDEELEGIENDYFSPGYGKLFERTCTENFKDFYIYENGAQYKLLSHVPELMENYIEDPTFYGSRLEPNEDDIFVVRIY